GRPRGARPPLRPGSLLALAALGIWTHPVLDLLNTYGVRLLMPFSDHWFYGDTLFILDPWLWLSLSLGVVFARRTAHPGRSARATARSSSPGRASRVSRLSPPATASGYTWMTCATPVLAGPQWW